MEENMLYTLELNARFSPKLRNTLEDVLGDRLRKEKVGIVEGGGTTLNDNGEVESCHIRIKLNGEEANLEHLKDIIERIGIPAGSKLKSNGCEIAVGSLSEVVLKLDREELGDALKEDTFEQLEERIEIELEELLKVNCRFYGGTKHPVANIYFYVIDAERTIEYITPLLQKSKIARNHSLTITTKGTASIAQRYFYEVKAKYVEYNAWEIGNKYHGANPEDIAQLQKEYPHISPALIELLSIIDGTYYREYGGEKMLLPLFFSTETYVPYYLNSVKDIKEETERNKAFMQMILSNEEVPVDPKINRDTTQMNLLHIADCTNNGGTSKLFLDFNPSSKGKMGQVVAYIHDPDAVLVLANSFEDFLLDVLNNDFYDLFEEYEGTNDTSDTKEEEYEDLEEFVNEISWSFNPKKYDDREELLNDLMERIERFELAFEREDAHEVVLKEPEIVVSYEAWISSVDQLHANEALSLEEDEELNEEDKEDGEWQVEIYAHLKADNSEGFTAIELLQKLHNLMANKELGDHIFFEQMEYDGHETEIEGLFNNLDGIPMFYIYCGS